MKVGVCTLSIGKEFKYKVEFCLKSIELYCEKHNYDLINDDSVADDREPLWNKIRLIEKYLPNYDYIVWIDADILIMNTDITLEYLIHNYLVNKELLVCQDIGMYANTGFMLIKNTEYMLRLLNTIYALPELAGIHHEQGVLTTLFKRNALGIQKRMILVPVLEQRLCNSAMCNYEPGDFLIHFLGIKNAHALRYTSGLYAPFLKEGHESKEEYLKRMEKVNRNYDNQFLMDLGNYAKYYIPKPYVKIGICTLYAGDKYSFGQVYYARKSLEAYAKRHNYGLHIRQEYKHETPYENEYELPPHWAKLKILCELCQGTEYDFVVWLDADTMIMNHDIRLEDIIQNHMSVNSDFLLSRDISDHINTGVIMVRNTEYAIESLDFIYKLQELRYRECQDQDALNRVYERNINKFKEKTTILPRSQQHIFNGVVGLYSWGHFLIHFFSLSPQGLNDAFVNFYPFHRDDENDERYQIRLNWIKNYNK
jgi:hypothetical protein